MSASHELEYYDDMARNLDANLAEVDMDDFHREDIHTILSTLPNMCCNDMQVIGKFESCMQKDLILISNIKKIFFSSL